MEPMVQLAARWRARPSPAEWAVGPVSPSTSRRTNGAAALAQAGITWSEASLPGLACLAIAVGLEIPCARETQWRQRLAGWKKAMQRACALGRRSSQATARARGRQRGAAG